VLEVMEMWRIIVGWGRVGWDGMEVSTHDTAGKQPEKRQYGHCCYDNVRA